MIKLDMQLLDSIGLAELPVAEKKAILQHIYESLETRVGARFASTMSDEQLDQFDDMMKTKDDAAAFAFLQSRFPNYKEIVQEEFEKLKNEVFSVSAQIVAESKQSLAKGNNPQQFDRPQPTPAIEAPQFNQPSIPAQPPMPTQSTMPVQSPMPTQPPAPMPEQPYRPEPAPYQPPQPYQPAPPTFQPPTPPDFPSQQPPAGPPQQN
ncbi:hypothetical protein EBZ57_02530 [bacterium]|nr:hypothetical protein [bacterium]